MYHVGAAAANNVGMYRGGIPLTLVRTLINHIDQCSVQPRVKTLDFQHVDDGFHLELLQINETDTILVVTISDDPELFREVAQAQCDTPLMLSADTELCTSAVAMYLYEKLQPSVSRMLRQAKTNNISFAGKHLGGSVASLFASVYSTVLYVPYIITLGSPPVSNQTFYTELGKTTAVMNVEQDKDFFTAVSKWPMEYPMKLRRNNKDLYQVKIDQAQYKMLHMDAARVHDESLYELYKSSVRVKYCT